MTYKVLVYLSSYCALFQNKKKRFENRTTRQQNWLRHNFETQEGSNNSQKVFMNDCFLWMVVWGFTEHLNYTA